jgi:hypothetical protein
MSPLQRPLRLVKWAHGLCLFALAVVVFGIGLIQSAAMLTIQAATAIKAGQDTRPSQGATESEWNEWNTRQQPVRDATSQVASGAWKLSALTVGLPVGVLLIVVIILLERVKGMLQREV